MATEKKSDNSLLSCGYFKAYANDVLKRQIEWFNHPINVKAREKAKQEWLARPWAERKLVTTKARIRDLRRRVGEVIAGEKFE